MYYRYATGWRSPAPVGPEFMLDGDDFSYAFPSDGGVTCLAVSLPVASHEQAGGDAAGYLEQSFRCNPRTADLIDDNEWVGGVYAGLPADSVWRESAGPGWALIGDAGTAQDPWAGLGMDTAARQAESFVQAFTASPDNWHDSYTRLRRERTHAGFEQTTRLAGDLRQMLG